MTSARTLFLLTLLTIALALILWKLSPPHPEQERLGYSTSTMALQMVRDWPTLTIVLATPAREGYRLHTLVDFAFILAYGSLWIAMAFRYGQRAWLRWTIAACVVAAMLCDISENLAILRVLGLERGFTDEMALTIRTWALRKWILLMLSWVGISLGLLGDRLLTLAVGYMFVAGVTITAIYLSPAMLELVSPALGITLILQTVHFLTQSREAARAAGNSTGPPANA